MKYRLTPLNIVGGLSLIYSVYIVFRQNPMGMGFIFFLFLFIAGIIFFVVDVVIQKLSTKYLWTLTIEICLLGLLTFYYLWTERNKIFIVPNKLTNHFVATIYGVENMPKLPKKPFGWTYEIKLPENGVLLTSSNFEDDLTETKMLNSLGKDLNSDTSKLNWGFISKDNFICNGKTYTFQIWLIDSNCCMYSNKEVDSFKLSLQRQFCGH